MQNQLADPGRNAKIIRNKKFGFSFGTLQAVEVLPEWKSSAQAAFHVATGKICYDNMHFGIKVWNAYFPIFCLGIYIKNWRRPKRCPFHYFCWLFCSISLRLEKVRNYWQVLPGPTSSLKKTERFQAAFWNRSVQRKLNLKFPRHQCPALASMASERLYCNFLCRSAICAQRRPRQGHTGVVTDSRYREVAKSLKKAWALLTELEPPGSIVPLNGSLWPWP